MEIGAVVEDGASAGVGVALVVLSGSFDVAKAVIIKIVTIVNKLIIPPVPPDLNLVSIWI